VNNHWVRFMVRMVASDVTATSHEKYTPRLGTWVFTGRRHCL